MLTFISPSQFANEGDQIVSRARHAGVSGMLVTGVTVRENEHAVDLAYRYQQYCWVTAGIHLHYASHKGDKANRLTELLALPQVVAIGECGLDFYRHFCPLAQQDIAFKAQLPLAAQWQKPLFLPCCEAYSRFTALLNPYLPHIPGGVVHCFTGNREELYQCLDLGSYIGITGWVCDERRGLALWALIPEIPAERLLIESDAPYPLPRDLTPNLPTKRNEPCFLPHIMAQIAQRGYQQDVQWLKQVIEHPVRQLFRLSVKEN